MIKVNDYVKVTNTDEHCFPVNTIGKVKSIADRKFNIISDGVEQILSYEQIIKVNVWECSHCGIPNEARKRKCSKCGTGKKLYQHQRVK